MRAKFLILLLLMIGVSLIVGLTIPAYYDWTGSDQSRPSPVLLPTAAGLLLLGIGASAALYWLPLADHRSTTEPGPRLQFKIRTMLGITALVGLLLMALTNLPRGLVCGGLLGIAFCCTARLCYRDRSFRWPVAALLACMYLPYLWIVSWSRLSSVLPEILWMGSGFPAFFFMLLLQGLFGQHSQELVWLSVLLTCAELGLGLSIIRLGPRRTIVYLVFVLLVATYGSFILNALVRI